MLAFRYVSPCSLVEVGRHFRDSGTSEMSRSSSVSILSEYGLDDRAIEVRSPAEEN
jgi:hypothetical protein